MNSDNTPINPWTLKPEQLTATQQRAIDPSYMRAHPTEAAMERYYNPFYGPQQPMYQMGQALGRKLEEPNGLGNLLDKGPLTGAAVLGGAGAVGGGIAGAITDLFTGHKGSAARLATLLGLSGAAVGGLSGYMRQPMEKPASWREQAETSYADPKDGLINAINSAQMLSFADKMQAVSAIPQLSPWQAQQLLSQVSTLGGAAAGAAIMRFLLGAGLIGTLAGGLLGGMIGRTINPPQKLGPLGMPSMSGYDFNGTPLF